jgi:hypothetical protein
MNKMPPKVLLDALNDNKNAIYVWVPITKTVRRPIRVTYPEAMDWVIRVAKENNGVVPYCIGTNEVFIGSVINYL